MSALVPGCHQGVPLSQDVGVGSSPSGTASLSHLGAGHGNPRDGGGSLGGGGDRGDPAGPAGPGLTSCCRNLVLAAPPPHGSLALRSAGLPVLEQRSPHLVSDLLLTLLNLELVLRISLELGGRIKILGINNICIIISNNRLVKDTRQYWPSICSKRRAEKQNFFPLTLTYKMRDGSSFKAKLRLRFELFVRVKSMKRTVDSGWKCSVVGNEDILKFWRTIPAASCSPHILKTTLKST